MLCCDVLWWCAGEIEEAAQMHVCMFVSVFRLGADLSYCVCMLSPLPQGPLSELFDQQQLLYDVSGAGNNWAHGHHGYGPQYRCV